jgi:8-oxo-dGTP pyrophosphatase MutT (NUDIX family)
MEFKFKEEESICVVNEQDQVIGGMLRSIATRHGMFWRASHIWFVTPRGEVIFQVRSMDKKTQPGMWDSTVAGHVGCDEDYLETALREAKEETGLEIPPNELIFLGKIEPVKIGDHYITTAFRAMYLYIFRGNISDLQVEKGEGAGFEKMFIEDVLSSDSKSEAGRKFVHGILTKPSLDILRMAGNIVDSYEFWGRDDV